MFKERACFLEKSEKESCHHGNNEPLFISSCRDDVCVGHFRIDQGLLKQAFSYINIDALGMYGMRHINENGEIANIGLMHPVRKHFENLCGRYGAGDINISELGNLMDPGSGVIVNSLQNPDLNDNPFNFLAAQFLSQLNFELNKSPETVNITLFIGSYEAGFRLHRDYRDVVSLVLDGRKNFLIGTQEEQKFYTVTQGNYIKWRSVDWHANSNPDRDWSVTLNFSVGPGPAETMNLQEGDPVKYVYNKVELLRYIDQMKEITS